jgi:hypothetical protein
MISYLKKNQASQVRKRSASILMSFSGSPGFTQADLLPLNIITIFEILRWRFTAPNEKKGRLYLK